MKTSETTPIQINWLVSKCEFGMKHLRINGGAVFLKNCDDLIPCNFSTDWAQAGPIIEREIVSIDKEEGGKRWAAYAWRSDLDLQKAIGPTLLIAAMRCLVASRLGDEVEIPEELK